MTKKNFPRMPPKKTPKGISPRKELDAQIRRLPLTLRPDPKRVLLQPMRVFDFSEPNPRFVNLFSRVIQLPEKEVKKKLDDVLADFMGRHEGIQEIFEERFSQIRGLLPSDADLSAARRQLLGAYFTNEYSLESSALFNPSIVPAPDQSGAGDGELKFILSLRATGEGHVSSITFRSGVIARDGGVRLDEVSRYVHLPRPHPAARYEKKLFQRKLQEMGVEYDDAITCTKDLGEYFAMGELIALVSRLRTTAETPRVRQAAERAITLAEANYTMRFPDGLTISEKILFPYAPTESNGIEDARFVRFSGDGGEAVYYATYTAYDGRVVLPQMVATADFQEFYISTLNGPAIRNKGLALFPRKIGGKFAMLGRQDGENIFLMFSDHLHFWHESRVLLRPDQPWQFMQIGNCGSPIETEAGWLVITHGVGPMRKYCLGAALLDLEDPSLVIGRLKDPLLWPLPDEREGYVPNVLYSCGSLVHGENLILPYAGSDTYTRFAIVPLETLIQTIKTN